MQDQVTDDKKVAIVTGAGNGLGAATAKRLAQGGFTVVGIDIDHQAAEAVAGEINSAGGRAEGRSLDVTDEDTVATVVDGLVAKHGRVDVLVNNAAIIHRGTLMTLGVDEFRHQVDVNLAGYFVMARAVIGSMVGAKSGLILNVASVTGLKGAEDRVGYVSSKGGVIAMTLSSAIDLAPHGVRVNVVCPGLLNTRLGYAKLAEENPQAAEELLDTIPLHRAAEPEEVADILHFLTTPSASYMTGSVIAVDGGWSL